MRYRKYKNKGEIYFQNALKNVLASKQNSAVGSKAGDPD
jgi:hypothetical protein